MSAVRAANSEELFSKKHLNRGYRQIDSRDEKFFHVALKISNHRLPGVAMSQINTGANRSPVWGLYLFVTQLDKLLVCISDLDDFAELQNNIIDRRRNHRPPGSHVLQYFRRIDVLRRCIES